VRLVGFSYKNI